MEAWLSHSCCRLTMVIAVWAGTATAIARCARGDGYLLLFVAYAWVSGIGVFLAGYCRGASVLRCRAAGYLFAVTFLSAIVAGLSSYARLDLADGREHLLHRVLDSLADRDLGALARAERLCL